MPQMNKGGKFIFGGSEIRADGQVQLPAQAADEYCIASEGKVYLFTQMDGAHAGRLLQRLQDTIFTLKD